jgi:hypothetical protein
MNVTVQELTASLTRDAADRVTTVAQATPPDRHHWQPMDNGRSVIDQVVECSIANAKWAAILRSGVYADLPRADAERAYADCDTLEKAIARLQTSAADLISAIRSVPSDALSNEVSTPWGPYPMARCCTHAYWNLTFHEGQINYVQTLYGDFDEHEPEA